MSQTYSHTWPSSLISKATGLSACRHLGPSGILVCSRPKCRSQCLFRLRQLRRFGQPEHQPQRHGHGPGCGGMDFRVVDGRHQLRAGDNWSGGHVGGQAGPCSSASGMSTCILWGINSNTISNGVIATVAFTISGSTVNTSSAIQLSSGAAAASTGASLSTSTTGSTVTIQQASATFSISGTISPGGSGTMVMLTGTASSSTTANGSGNYTFAGLANGSYTVTPSNSGYTFTPSSRVVNVSGANVGAINFSGTANAQPDFSIASPVQPSWRREAAPRIPSR